MKMHFMTGFGEIGALAQRIADDGADVTLQIDESTCKKAFDGLVEKENKWWRLLGRGTVFVFDGCEQGDLQDWLRDQGELVVGGTAATDELENDRQAGQKWFRKIGFTQPESHNFKDIDAAIAFVKEHADRKWILKQNGDLPKSVNHPQKFDDGADMILHLEDLKKKWNEHEFGGPFDCDLMEMVEGMEIAASAFFNGTDFLRNPDGSIAGFLNWEHKKQAAGDMGETTGETGTLFYGCAKKNAVMEQIMGSPEIVRVLKKAGYRGVFDINGCILDSGEFVGFEPTCRFGVPATDYEFMEGIGVAPADLLRALAAGEKLDPKIVPGWGMVLVVVAKPFPVEVDLDDEGTSVGEILWAIVDGKHVKQFTPDQLKHIHLENFRVNKDGRYEVAGKNGYLLTVTGTGKTIADCREKLLAFVKDNLYVAGMIVRPDIGKRVEEWKMPTK